jgi:hypothetical protein
MAEGIAGNIDGLMARTRSDADLREQMLADPKATIQAETGMTVPADWAIVASVNDGGHVVIEFENGELPDDYLELVAGGNDEPECCP